MHVQFTFSGMTVTADEQAYIAAKMTAVTDLEDSITRADVEIAMTPQGKVRVEATLVSPRQTYRAEEVGATAMAAADVVEDELKEQIRTYKERGQTLRRRGARSIKKKLTLDASARF